MGVYYYDEKNNDCGVGVICVGGWCVLFFIFVDYLFIFWGYLLLWVCGCSSVVVGGVGCYGWALLWPSYLFGSFVYE